MEKEIMIKVCYMIDVCENYIGKNILFIYIVCVWIFDVFGFIVVCVVVGVVVNM